MPDLDDIDVEDVDVTVDDLQTTIKVLTVVKSNIDQHQAYFKESALDQIVNYLNQKAKQVRQQLQQRR